MAVQELHRPERMGILAAERIAPAAVSTGDPNVNGDRERR
jgi:hypothetical protein